MGLVGDLAVHFVARTGPRSGRHAASLGRHGRGIRFPREAKEARAAGDTNAPFSTCHRVTFRPLRGLRLGDARPVVGRDLHPESFNAQPLAPAIA
jgi:hypothetical protein